MRTRLVVLILLLLCAIPAYGQSYNTAFPNTQNPISESGNWINGGTTGLQWGNVQSTPGKAFGVSLPSQFGDPTAILTGSWNATQTATATVFYTGSFAGPGHEVELRLRTSIAANNITGYEILCSVVVSDPYMQIVRWNGALGSFTVLDQNSVGCANGDTFQASVTGAANNTQIQVFKNGAAQTFTNCHCTTVTDTSGIASGAPGIGFYDNQDTNWNQFGFSQFSATAGGGGGGGNPATCSSADVQTAINNATAGATLTIPPGTCTWSGANAVVLAKAITLQGSGPASAPTTIIHMGRDVSSIFHVTKQTSGVIRIKNINFVIDPTGTAKATPHPVVFDGPWPNGQPIVFTNNILNLNLSDFGTISTPGGIIAANNTIHGTTVGDTFFALKLPSDNTSWTTTSSQGTLDTSGWMNTYIETNLFDGGANATDCDDECRVVYRFNTGSVGGTFNSHGADTSPQGMRQFEIYGNHFLFPNPPSSNCGGNTSPYNINQWVWIRGGTGVIYNNDFDPLVSGCWGTKANFKLAIRNIEDNFRPSGMTCSTITYPSYHQLGQDWNGSALVQTNPIYFWGNVSNKPATLVHGFQIEVFAGFMFVLNPDGTPADPCGFDWNTFDRWGRDQINTTVGSVTLPTLGGSVDGIGGTAKPSYTAYPYPHPLVGGGSTPPPPPNAPTNLVATASGTTVNLTWTASSGTPVPTAYNVYRGTTNGGPYTLIKTPVSATSYSDTGLAAGTYFYVVTGFNGTLVSTISGNGTTATVTCSAVCSFPTNSSFNLQGTSVNGFNTTAGTVTSQPNTTTFTYANSTNASASGGSAWISGAESTRSNQAQATIGGVATISLVPSSLSFASRNVGTTSPSQAITLTNTSPAGTNVTVSSISVTGTNPTDFASTNNCIGTLVSGQFCQINVTFTPTTTGARSAQISVFDNATGSPQTVPLSGTGVTGTPIVSLSPSPVNFGSQLTSTTSAPITVTLSNASGGTPTLDIYGGRTDITCTNTGWFHTQKINSHWWLCDPLGNVFISQMVDFVTPDMDSTYSSKVTSKYGGNIQWTTPTNQRLLSWGFNTLSLGTYFYNLPFATNSAFPLDSNNLRSQPVKMPFTSPEERGAYYSVVNPVIGSGPLLTNPVKNMSYSFSSFYPGFVPSVIADYYDSGIATWVHADLSSGQDFFWNQYSASPYKNWLIAIWLDDGDQMYGFGAGPDYTTIPAGHNNSNLGLLVATMSPVQTANSVVASGYVYTNTQMYSKIALRDALTTKYGTIGSLNTAWGSTYTTFNSSGTCVGTQPITCTSSAAADSVGTGNGSTLTFSTTLSTATISKYSLQILVAGIPVAGDTGAGVLFGPNLASGTINYTTKALSITFTAGHAPANGAAITATYIANGWGVGTGLLDEDNRVAHNAYLGTDWVALSSADPDVKTDLNNFLGQIAGQYFNTMATQIHATFPNAMTIGEIGTWGVPSAAPVLQAAGQYLDLFGNASGATTFTQAQLDFIATNYGDKPYFNGFYTVAQADSALSAFTSTGDTTVFATQAAKASAYQSMNTAQLNTAKTTAGNFPYVGTEWWEYIDSWSEHLNWGLVTHLDNAYDAREPSAGTVACTAPLAGYNCGGEPAPGGTGVLPFSNLIAGVTTANGLWRQSQAGAPQILATPYYTITGTNAGDFANAGTGTCANGLTIIAGASCTVNLTFTPSATGIRTATLNIFGTVNLTDTLNGNGITAKCQMTNLFALTGTATVCGP